MIANAARAYRRSAAQVASPVGLVVLLYDAVLDSLHRALRALGNHNVEQRTADLNHAIMVVGELQASLDFQQGGEVAQHLQRFYTIARGKIIEANIKASKELLHQLTGEFASLRDALQQAERSSDAASTEPRAIPNTIPTYPTPLSDEVTASHWSG